MCYNPCIMKIIETKITLSELDEMAKRTFGDMVKAVVDLDREVMALDAELHADEEALLLENGSKQEHLWGINLYPKALEKKFIEFDSMINLRPWQGNRSRSVEDKKLRDKIITLVDKLVENDSSKTG